MTPVFADTHFYLALLSRRDEHHRAAVEFVKNDRRKHVTSEFVLLETADGLARTRRRALITRLWDRIAGDPATTLVPASKGLLADVRRLYARHADKQWSLTDCTSIVIMRDRGLIEALTGDRHFIQAGFQALLQSSGD